MGMLETGKMKPDNKIVGNIKAKSESIRAVCCVSEMVEIKTPKASEVMVNSMLCAKSKNKLPATGTLKTTLATPKISTTLKKDRMTNGVTLPKIITK